MSSPAQDGRTGPAERRYRRRHLYALLGSGALLVGALGYIGLVDPHRPGSFFPLCPFRLLTGLNCPACGALRMTYDVLHGDLVAAINDNVLVLVGIPLLAGWVLLRRRSVPDRETMLRVGDLEVDLLKREVRRGGRLIDLLPREYRLLEYLLRHVFFRLFVRFPRAHRAIDIALGRGLDNILHRQPINAWGSPQVTPQNFGPVRARWEPFS